MILHYLTMKPNLVLIVGDLAIRYVDGKPEQQAMIDFSAGKRSVLASIEYFRANGVGKVDEEA